MKIDLHFLSDWLLAIVVSVGGFLWWLIRFIFTNHKRIELLEKDNEYSKEMRKSHESLIKEIRTDQKALLGHILIKKD